MKFSSGVLPPEMFASLDVKEKEQFENYWQNEKTENTELWEKIKPVGSSRENKYFVVRTFDSQSEGNNTSSLPYDLVKASASYDIWSFGVLLFNYLSDRPLFNVNRDEDLDKEEMEEMANLTDFKLTVKINENISDPFAADLLTLILKVKPNDRIASMKDILNHPFFEISARQQSQIDEAFRKVKSELMFEILNKRYKE
jgi:serine/threonine protein kinase